MFKEQVLLLSLDQDSETVTIAAVVCGSSAAGCLTVLGQYMNMDLLSSYPLLLTVCIIALGALVQFLTTSGGKHSR